MPTTRRLSPTRLSRRYDALLFIDESRALDPLGIQPKEEGEVPETYPFAV